MNKHVYAATMLAVSSTFCWSQISLSQAMPEPAAPPTAPVAARNELLEAAIARLQHETAAFDALKAEYELGRSESASGQKESAIAAYAEFLEQVERFKGKKKGRRHELNAYAHQAANALWQHYESSGNMLKALIYARMATSKYPHWGWCGNDRSPQLNQLRLAELLRKLGECDEALAICVSLETDSKHFESHKTVKSAKQLSRQIRAEFPDVKEPESAED